MEKVNRYNGNSTNLQDGKVNLVLHFFKTTLSFQLKLWWQQSETGIKHLPDVFYGIS